VHDAALLARAERAADLVDRDPDAALAAAAALITPGADPETTSVALRTTARVHARQGRALDARRSLHRAIRVAEKGGLPVRAAQARSSLVVVLVSLGQFDAALTEADAAAPALSGHDSGLLIAQRAVVLSRLDRTDEALAAYSEALDVLPVADVSLRAMVWSNRGLLHTYRGNFDGARRDLERCLDLCDRHQLRAVAADAIHNVGYLALLRGDLVASLEHLDRSERLRGELQLDALPTVLDRADVLLTANLAEESRRAAHAAVAIASTAGRQADLAEAELTLARAELVAGNALGARHHAVRARSMFHHQGRDGWAAIASELALRARWLAGERGRRIVADARQCAEGLTATGWNAPALRARILAAEALLARGRRAEAAEELRGVAAARRRGPADLRVAAWHAEALVRLAHGDRGGALRAVSAGLDVVDAHSAALGATDLRAQSMTRGRPLADLGLDLVIGRDRPRDVLRWLERARTTALRRRPARPPRDAGLAAQLADLRRVTTSITAARGAGQDTSDLRREQLRLERSVRDHARHARGGGETTSRFDVGRLADALGDRGLVEYFYVGDELRAVVLVDGRCRVVTLSSYGDALSEAESLRFAMHRLARRHGTEASLGVALVMRDHAAAALDASLLGPIERLLGDRDLVIVPTMSLHALPWPALPSLQGRPVSVAPSAAQWVDAACAPRRRTGDVVLVAGPDLMFAEPELRAVGRHYRGAVRLRGQSATAERVQLAIDGARVAHIACHGHFRTDNPQFSSLRMADGPLMVYDLERLRQAPDLIVLSACDTALSAVHPGDELVGLSSALFALGTRTLVAAVSPVDDEAAMTLMIDFHARLAHGRSPAAALADAQQAHGVIGFACFGAG